MDFWNSFGALLGILDYEEDNPVTMVYDKCTHYGDTQEASFFPLPNGVTLSGAGGSFVYMFEPNTVLKLILDLGGAVNLKFTPWCSAGPQDIVDLQAKPHEPCPVARLNWPDRDAPPIAHHWWPKLYAKLGESYQGNVVIACIGGHGRTGTAIASLLLVAFPEMTPEDAVKQVRSIHCHKAVESEEQFEYLLGFRPEWKPTKWYQKQMDPPKHGVSGFVGTGPLCSKNSYCKLGNLHTGGCVSFGSKDHEKFTTGCMIGPTEITGSGTHIV